MGCDDLVIFRELADRLSDSQCFGRIDGHGATSGNVARYQCCNQ
jgi:hypothetical protein